MKFTNDYKRAFLSSFLRTKHGIRLIERGLRNTVAYYTLPQGVMKANRYGDVTFYPRHEPQAFVSQIYTGQLDMPATKQATMFGAF